MYARILLLIVLVTFPRVNSKLKLESLYYDEEEQDEDLEIKEEEQGKTSSDWSRQLELDVLKPELFREPPYSRGNPIKAQVIFTNIDHVAVDESQQTVTTTGRFCLIWHDPRIGWNPADYNGVSDLFVGPYDVWSPKLRILDSVSGYRSSRDIHISNVHIMMTRFPMPGFKPSYVLACPSFYAKVGCAMDLSEYPNDEHSCGFAIHTAHHTDVQLVVGGASEREKILKMKHTMTRDESRPSVSGFVVTNISSQILYYDGENMTETQEESWAIPMCYQTIRLRRHAPYYTATVVLPSLLFACLNVCASVMVDTAHSLALFLLNIFFIGLFLQDMMDKLPLYYDQLPDAVLFWAIHLSISIVGVMYMMYVELARRYYKVQYVVYRIPSKLDQCTSRWALNKIFSFGGGVFVLTLLSFTMFIV